MRTSTRQMARLRLGLVAVSAAILQGCASSNDGIGLGFGGGPGVTAYQEANAVAPQGYQVASNDAGGARVTATGSAATPNERLLKIALAQAAAYGAERNKKTFRIGEPVYSTRCGKTMVSERGNTRSIAPNDYRVVVIDATFGGASADPADKPTKETSQALIAELQAETIPLETQAALVAQLKQACGRSPS
jgi:hypothetical protein